MKMSLSIYFLHLNENDGDIVHKILVAIGNNMLNGIFFVIFVASFICVMHQLINMCTHFTALLEYNYMQ